MFLFCVDSTILGLMSDDSNDSGVINNSNVTSENETDVSNHDHHGECCLKEAIRFHLVHPLFLCYFFFVPRMFLLFLFGFFYRLYPIRCVLDLFLFLCMY